MGQHRKVSDAEAVALLARFQAGSTTLKAERARFGVVSNAPLRRVLLPLVDNDMGRYLALVRADRAAYDGGGPLSLVTNGGGG